MCSKCDGLRRIRIGLTCLVSRGFVHILRLIIDVVVTCFMQIHYRILMTVKVDIETKQLTKGRLVAMAIRLKNILKHFYSANIIALFWNNLHNYTTLHCVFSLYFVLLFDIVLSYSIYMYETVRTVLAD